MAILTLSFAVYVFEGTATGFKVTTGEAFAVVADRAGTSIEVLSAFLRNSLLDFPDFMMISLGW
jgi:hypothetical protein